ncbi:MAG: hypothetical protein HYV63_18305 [Candidatus Schekmanbacteria bacterium]|nr:hypothetical protein [Candidatus Schekmanbacteria bacterium]
MMSRRKKVLLWVVAVVLSLPLLEIALIFIADMPLATYDLPLEGRQNLAAADCLGLKLVLDATPGDGKPPGTRYLLEPGSPKCKPHSADAQNLTSEQIAVRYSRRALVNYGVDVYKIMPIAHKEWGNVFFQPARMTRTAGASTGMIWTSLDDITTLSLSPLTDGTDASNARSGGHIDPSLRCFSHSRRDQAVSPSIVPGRAGVTIAPIFASPQRELALIAPDFARVVHVALAMLVSPLRAKILPTTLPSSLASGFAMSARKITLGRHHDHTSGRQRRYLAR